MWGPLTQTPAASDGSWINEIMDRSTLSTPRPPAVMSPFSWSILHQLCGLVALLPQAMAKLGAPPAHPPTQTHLSLPETEGPVWPRVSLVPRSGRVPTGCPLLPSLALGLPLPPPPPLWVPTPTFRPHQLMSTHLPCAPSLLPLQPPPGSHRHPACLTPNEVTQGGAHTASGGGLVTESPNTRSERGISSLIPDSPGRGRGLG